VVSAVTEAFIATGPMEFGARLSVIETACGRLAEAARGSLGQRVPTCPEWTVDDLVTHLAITYLHKIECTRLGAQPDPWPIDPPDTDHVDWLLACADRMVACFRERGPDGPSWTWEESNPTVGFWARRMAVETSLHQVDVALATARPYHVDPDLAVDGIDETLTVVVGGDWSDQPQPPPDHTVLVQAPRRAWLISLTEREVRVEETPPGAAAEATIEGPADDLLLWLWTRPPAGPLAVTGSEAALTRLRAQLALVTR
jgi:uncharacterized protein (TIGR03083 family)